MRPMSYGGTPKEVDLILSNLRYGIEPLLYDYNVDVVLWAHEHNYERMFPLYNYVCDDESLDPYFNPKYPVHITTASAVSIFS